MVVRTAMALVAVAVLMAALTVQADDKPAAKPSDVETRQQTADLKRRAIDWWTARSRVADKCPRCHGERTVSEVVPGIGGGVRRVPCPTCGRRGTYVFPKLFRKLYYEMMSPAFRLRPRVREAMERAYKATDQGSEWSTSDSRVLGYTSWDLLWDGERITGLLSIKKFRITKAELQDKTHGIVHVVIGNDTISRPHYWVLAEEAPGKKAWFVHHEAADGAWPSPVSAEPQLPPQPAAQPPVVQAVPADAALEPVATEERDAILALVGTPAHPYAVFEMGRRKDVLVVKLRTKGDLGAQIGRRHVAGCAIGVARAVLPERTTLGGIECVWHWPYKDRFGNVTSRPAKTSYMDRDTFQRAIWKNLSQDEQANLFRWQDHDQEGWTPFDPGK